MGYESTKPVYCPDAVATKHGWMDPKTNELLVAIKSLDEKLKYGSIDNTGFVVEDSFNAVASVPTSHNMIADGNANLPEQLSIIADGDALIEGDMINDTPDSFANDTNGNVEPELLFASEENPEVTAERQKRKYTKRIKE